MLPDQDAADLIALKIRKAKTDPELISDNVTGLEGRPEAANLMGIYAALADQDLESICAQFGGWPFSKFKAALSDLAVARLGPITTEINRLKDDPGYVDGVLRDGAERARAIAAPVIEEVYETVGFLPGKG